MMHPKPDQIEITVFGPAYGEAIAIHVGSGKWILIDSCLDDSRKPASTEYLARLGVDIEHNVVAIAASHWHDDHIKGLSSVLELCKSATFALPSALQKSEFVGLLQAFEDQPVVKLDRGGTEILHCMRLVMNDRRKVKPLNADTIVFDCDAGILAHGQRVELRSLSPSGKQFVEFLKRVEGYVAISPGTPKKRLVEPGKNDLSSVMLLTVGDRSMLLGADLENSGDDDLGWKAVVELRKERTPKPRTYKIPHHGSQNAHSDEVWDEILHEHTVGVVTPWRNGNRMLPTPSDRKRIASRSKDAYITSTSPRSIKHKYSREVAKLIRQSGSDLSSVTLKCGSVTLVWGPQDEEPVVTLRDGAQKL